MLDGVRFSFTIEPPLSGDGMSAIPEGDYPVSLSHSSEQNRLLPYVLSVPEIGAVKITWGLQPRNVDMDTYIRITTSLDPVLPHSDADMRLFNELMLKLRAGRAEGVSILVTSTREKTMKANETPETTEQEEVDPVEVDDLEDEDDDLEDDLEDDDTSIIDELEE